jgi:hypothetical protein
VTVPDTRVAAAEVAAAEAASMEAAEAEAVDEEGRRAVAARELAFEHVDIECQLVALELRRLQRDDGIADF